MVGTPEVSAGRKSEQLYRECGKSRLQWKSPWSHQASSFCHSELFGSFLHLTVLTLLEFKREGAMRSGLCSLGLSEAVSPGWEAGGPAPSSSPQQSPALQPEDSLCRCLPWPITWCLLATRLWRRRRLGSSCSWAGSLFIPW